jgi:hypothetical protein
MANFKCETCRARVWRDGVGKDLPAELCPGCGGPLSHVSSPSELVGLRCLRAPRAPSRKTSQRVGDEIRATFARHDAGRGRR